VAISMLVAVGLVTLGREMIVVGKYKSDSTIDINKEKKKWVRGGTNLQTCCNPGNIHTIPNALLPGHHTADPTYKEVIFLVC